MAHLDLFPQSVTMTHHLSAPGTDSPTNAPGFEGCHSFCCTLPFKWATFVPKGFSLVGLSAVQTPFFSLNRQGTRGKDKVDYCVPLQPEYVAVLKKKSLTLSFAEYWAKRSDMAAETLQTGCNGMPLSNCSVFTVKKYYLLLWQEMRESKFFPSAFYLHLLGTEIEGGKCNNI